MKTIREATKDMNGATYIVAEEIRPNGDSLYHYCGYLSKARAENDPVLDRFFSKVTTSKRYAATTMWFLLEKAPW